MKKYLLTLMVALMATATHSYAADYVIDTRTMHAFIQFKVKHLGYSWLLGRFNQFSGTFRYDENNPGAASVNVTIETASVDSNFAERDKHLRSKDFLNVKAHPQAKFVSTGYQDLGNGKGRLQGDFSLNGVTKAIDIDVNHIGAGKDPWGGYRRGFEGKANIQMADFNLAKAAMLGAAAQQVELYFSIEGVRR